MYKLLAHRLDLAPTDLVELNLRSVATKTDELSEQVKFIFSHQLWVDLENVLLYLYL